MSPLTGRALIGRIFLGTILVLLAVAGLGYGIDFAVFRVRATTNHNAYDSVVVRQYYAVLQKNGRTQFIFNPPAPQSCVKALFPHAGLLPCWYLRRHPERRTDI
jgi:hypothetical protein